MKANEPFSSSALAPLIAHTERRTDAVGAKVPLNSWRGIFLDARDAPWRFFRNSSARRRRRACGVRRRLAIR